MASGDGRTTVFWITDLVAVVPAESPVVHEVCSRDRQLLPWGAQAPVERLRGRQVWQHAHAIGQVRPLRKGKCLNEV